MLPELYSQNLTYDVNIGTAIYTLTPPHRAPCFFPGQFAYLTDSSTMGQDHLPSCIQIKIDKLPIKWKRC